MKFLDNYANDLAGKTNAFDRAWRDTMPEAFQAVHAVAGRVKSNAILMNVSSAMAQGLNVPERNWVYPRPAGAGSGGNGFDERSGTGKRRTETVQAVILFGGAVFRCIQPV